MGKSTLDQRHVINNVPSQGINMKIKLNLKVEEIFRDCSSIFCEVNDNIPRFCLVLSEKYS